MDKCFGALPLSSIVGPAGEATIYVEVFLQADATFFFKIKVEDFPVDLAQIWAFLELVRIWSFS